MIANIFARMRTQQFFSPGLALKYELGEVYAYIMTMILSITMKNILKQKLMPGLRKYRNVL